jgi:hypothetical protein
LEKGARDRAEVLEERARCIVIAELATSKVDYEKEKSIKMTQFTKTEMP